MGTLLTSDGFRLWTSSIRLLKIHFVALCGLVFIVLAIGPKVRSSNRAVDGGFLSGIKIDSTISFIGEAKPAVPCFKILRRVKLTYL
jgi:hypothetical protein